MEEKKLTTKSFQEEWDKSLSSAYEKIEKLIDEGQMYRVSRGEYSIAKKKVYSYPFSEFEEQLSRFLEQQGLPCLIYDSGILDEWLNHLIKSDTVILEVEREYGEFVFEHLKEEGIPCLLSPSEEEYYRYKDPGRETVLIKPLNKEAPRKGDHILLEKLAVDLYCDKTLHYLYEGAEVGPMLAQMFETYQVKTSTLYSYAKRKKIYPKFRTFLEKALEENAHE